MRPAAVGRELATIARLRDSIEGEVLHSIAIRNYAETKDALGRCQALQENGYWQSETRSRLRAPYPHVQEQQAETPARPGHHHGQGGHQKGETHDPVLAHGRLVLPARSACPSV